MELTEAQLRKLVERVMELTLELTVEQPKKKVLVVLSGYDANRFSTVLQSLSENSSDVTVVISKEQLEFEEVGKVVCEFANKIVTPKEALATQAKYESIIFPAMPRDVLAKCALCISDTYEVMLIQKAFEEGIKVKIAKGGIAKFTGKEPESYQNIVLGYIRTLLEYGIEIELDSDTEKR
ncbi:hypothetical protein SAMN02910384_02474 [Pseudobutyrivibrio sp. ACV-2]|uniref:hypothetical protein n=1 Tax=Pseudobutyrivibrio sp. ACV-2 TaxID=1520801 RepID=UPI000898EECD|nr:hypothetical protein [Pseudobutyrivibrio sp. ACV-2]SEA83462.1 hypothetical protein SAMN02910384_02474 [Pseudobutyrivibrio sp. ACV-2]